MYRFVFLILMTSLSLNGQEIEQKKIPDLSIELLNRTKTTIQELVSDGPLIIDFWATWCEPCKKEMVHLEEINQKYADKGLTILAISQDSPKSLSKVKSFIRSKRYSFKVGLDPNQQIGQKLGAQLLPTTIIVDKDLNIVWRHQGYLPGDEMDIEEQVITLLHEE